MCLCPVPHHRYPPSLRFFRWVGVIRLPFQGSPSQPDLESIRACLTPSFPSPPTACTACRVYVRHTHVHGINTHGAPVCVGDSMHVPAYACLSWVVRS